jgi:phospholipid/cholesterol/gamma-HCH transport system ATP-binding protein
MKYVIDNLIYEVQQELYITSVVISHDIDSVFKIDDYLAILYDGKTILYGTCDKFRDTMNF